MTPVCRVIQVLVWTILGMLAVAPGWGQSTSCPTNGTPATTSTISTTTIYSDSTVNAAQQMNTYQVELKARMQGSSTYLYDQTFNAAYADSTVQAAIVQAKTVLTNSGAVSFTGPTLLSSSQSTSSSTSTGPWVTTGSATSYATTEYVGPQTIMIGANQSIACAIPAGGIDFDLLGTTTLTRQQTVTTTNTTLTSQVYEIDGVVAQKTCDVQQVESVISQALGTAAPSNDLNGDGVVNVVDVQIEIDAVVFQTCSSTSTASWAPAPAAAGAIARWTIPVLSYAAITDLGTLGGASTVAYAVNNLGQVVGSSGTAEGVHHAFLWQAGRMTDLGANTRSAYGVNDAGEVVGASESGGFRYANGQIAILPERAIAINNLGDTVGDSFEAVGAQASAINDAGQVAGWATPVRAFFYDGVRFADVGTLGGSGSMAFGVNRAGQVVGASQTTGDRAWHAFLYTDGWMLDLGTLGGTDSQADGIDRNGLIVGWSRTAGGESHACLWTSSRIVDLNSFIGIAPGVWLEEATAVNEAEQMVVNGSNGHTYLITLPAGLQ